MKLFDLKDFKPCSEFKQQITTPLGSICFNAKIGKTGLTDNTTVFSNNKGDYIFGWYSDSFDVELLICSPSLHLPDNMHVEGCRVAFYRILLRDRELACEFSANWCSDYLWIDNGPDSGEHLEARTWENNDYVVTLGTQDGEMLHIRAINNDMMPVKFKSDVDQLALVESSSVGLVVPIEKVYQNQVCQIHFAVAWAPKKPYDVSTWYAVDISHRTMID